ncbi:alpha-2-macroglobulin-like protein [Plakobranchus ocellatus]|uniref:Alpha-2-macroglobulin-like protein n=1 Tax=Plakobranchus ocellatus TaxID=259542 RepID=A0AAV3YLZ4_9GAST|nr:alpha-2-macroglobulin-like protein [Plakobranchus ocellatus]
MPLVLRGDTRTQACMILYGNTSGEREVTLTFSNVSGGVGWTLFKNVFTLGRLHCVKFMVPPPGHYKVILSNNTGTLHDPVKIIVLDNKLISLVQTDKSVYKPGQKVRFQILTILTTMMPRTGQIHSVYIKDSCGLRVKQYLNLTTRGIISLDFQLGLEAKQGEWKIEVNLEKSDGTKRQKTVVKFTVKKYVPTLFEVKIELPCDTVWEDEIVRGRICARYTNGKPVIGNLSLDVECKEVAENSISSVTPNYHVKTRIDGCYNFSMETKMWRTTPPFFSCESFTQAAVTEDETGVTVSQNHIGRFDRAKPRIWRYNDYTNRYFKPGLPYYGKVIVTKPDGSPASGEAVQVRVDYRYKSLRFKRTFTTDESGEAKFALCRGFTEATKVVKISAGIPNTNFYTLQLGRQDPYDIPLDVESIRSNIRIVRQWFSPSLSYVQLPKFDSPHPCFQNVTLPVLYTTTAGSKIQFQYQVMARGKVVMEDQIDPWETATPGFGEAIPPKGLCLQKDARSKRESRDDDFTDQGKSEGPFRKQEYEEVQKRGYWRAFVEPVVRPANVSDKVFTFHLDLEIKHTLFPKFTLLLYHVREDGEVVADSTLYDVEPCFENQVKLEFNESQAIPGQSVNLNLVAEPGSVCGVGIVEGDHHITLAKIVDTIKEFTNPHRGPNTIIYEDTKGYCRKRAKVKAENFLPLEHVDAMEAFKKAGSLVLTDLNLETRPCKADIRDQNNAPCKVQTFCLNGGTCFYIKSLQMEYCKCPVDLSGKRCEKLELNFDPLPKAELAHGVVYYQDYLRKMNLKYRKMPDLTETWLWTLVDTGPEGEIVLTETVPETVTSWSAKALCVNEKKGFGISKVTSLTTFKPISLSVHQVHAAVIGERLPVIVTVNSNLKKCIPVQLILDLSKKFEVHNIGQFRDPVCVCGGQPYRATYYVTANAAGSLPVWTKATVVSGTCGETRDTDLGYAGMSDQVHRKMLVKAEGVEQSYTYASYLCSKEGKPLSEVVPLQLPKGKKMIRDSALGEVQVIGDIMGAALNNLHYLVRMPTGCGEQNMIGFVSSIIVLNYLYSTGNLQETTRQEALNNMEIGYQRALIYRHKDGSFSAFGEKDPKGSVWLTSFVVKSFAQAKKHIFIDENDLNLSMDFLVQSQLETGCFRETGKVLSSYMMGGLGQGWGQINRRSPQGALTAYVLMALMEAGADINDTTIELGMQCMNSELRTHKNRLDPYTLALVTLINMKYNSTSPDAQYAFNLLHKKALKNDKHIYWRRGKRQPPTTNTKFYPAAPSAEVEMASYALMSYLQFSSHHAEKIALWLTRQRNSFGGFASTQDTVVALDALSQFAASVYSRDPAGLKVKVIFNSTTVPSSVEFSVSEGETNTRFLLQSESIPALPTTLHISTSGTGCALIQANVRYNKPARTYVRGEKPNFTLKIHTKPYQYDRNKCDHRTLYIRVRKEATARTFSRSIFGAEETSTWRWLKCGKALEAWLHLHPGNLIYVALYYMF